MVYHKKLGIMILNEKPRVSYEINDLIKLDKNTFGYHYAKWM